MMEFSHPLPSYRCEGRQNGTYNNPELEYPGMVNTLNPRLGLFMEALRDTVRGERRLLLIDGRVLLCNHNWIRDCYYMYEVFKHWEYDDHSFYDFLLENQTDRGFFFELVKQMDDEHWKMVDEECRKLFPEDNMSLVRLELEADIEYEMVLYAYLVWQVNGDIDYVRRILPKLEKAMNYVTSDPKRWDSERGLAIRPYTIDMWDFTNEMETERDRRIYPDRICAMHGDNSGDFAAMRVLAEFNRLLGDQEKAKAWEDRAETLRKNMFRCLWNGSFFVHQLPITCAPIDGQENGRLSLSNVYDINRGVTSPEESRSIIREYMHRRETTDAFCEFFTVDPPYQRFMRYDAGYYVNGAMSPFTAGELALASFENGYEEYGYDIITRFLEMWEKDRRIYFLYARGGGPVSENKGPSGWGAAALLKAVEQGLAGIRDLGSRFDRMGFAPRWAVTEYTELRYITGYEKSHIHVDVRYELKDDVMKFSLACPSSEIRAHVLLPKSFVCVSVMSQGCGIEFSAVSVFGSPYADFVIRKEPGEKAEFELRLVRSA